MSDLRERLQELAEAAARQGRTPGPQAALRAGRRRRMRLAGGTAALLVLVLIATVLGSDRLTGRPAPLAPPATTRPSATSSPTTVLATTPNPDPKIEYPSGPPLGPRGAAMARDVASELANCQGGDPDRPTVLVAWGKAHGRTWLIMAKPPRRGEVGMCWDHGLFEASGAGGFGNMGGGATPLKPVEASGASNVHSGGRWWGQVIGTVTKRAARVRVFFQQRIAPLELTPIQAGDRFPVNFYVGFYPQPEKDTQLVWPVAHVVAYDLAGRVVAECQATAGPGFSC
jgi:hypothetical protein